ncbi:MAG: response regulator [Chloroflexota bacterium]
MPADHPQDPALELDLSQPSILLVDDHEQVRASLRAWLSAIFPAFTYLEAGSGEEALQVAWEQKPRLVLMDIGLPGISGLEAARAILRRQPGMKVVMLSIHDETRYRENAAAVGASDFVSKSNMRAELIPAIMKALENTAEESQG